MIYLYLFIYLLAAHLLADFVFQPEGLIAWKYKDWKGVFVHALILFVTGLVFFWPLVLAVNLVEISVLLVNAVLHFYMDLHKIQLEQKHRKYIKIFFLDQFFHLIVLILSALVLGYVLQFDLTTTGNLLAFFSNFLPLAIYLCVAVLITYVFEIIKFQFSRQKNNGKAMKFNYKKMFIRLMFLSLIFGAGLFLLGFKVAQTFFV